MRYEHHWTDFISPPLSYLSQNQTLLATTELDSLSLVARNQTAIDSVVLARLDAGQVVLDEIGTRLFARVALQEPDLLLQVESRSDGEEIYRMYLTLIGALINEHGYREGLDEIADTFSVDIALLRDETVLEDQAVLNSLVQHDQYLDLAADPVTGLIRLSSGEVFRVSFPDTYAPFSTLVVILLLLFVIAALVFYIYFVLQTLDRQLRNVETVASRIARGELDARVKRADSQDAVGRLGSAFNSMADHIQRLMYIQKEMIHAVSHELRTPVARIRFGVQMIEDCPDRESLQKQIKGIDGDIQELDELIDEILTYARLEQGGPILAFHEADVSEIVEQVISEQSSVKPELTIQSEYRKGSKVWKESEIEARYIHRSIQNLVGNATRYCKSTVKVVCSFDQETCRVDVEDDGPGIPEDEWESVFTPFARLDDSRTRSSGGYGLGLSIVRRILYWHGGQAFLGRSEMGGAKFSLVWPRKQQGL